MNRSIDMKPLPLYGLGGSFTGSRLIEGDGRDQRTVVHRPVGMSGTLTVGVDRRTTAHGGDASGTLLQADLVRLGMATALVMDLPNIGDDVFEIAAEVARDSDAWKVREIKVEGEAVSGYERVYEGMWVVYYLTAALIVYVLAPVALRPDTVELRRLGLNEVAQRKDWPT